MGHYLLDAIRDKIESDKSSGSLWDSVNGRVYERVIPVDPEFPVLRYTLISDPLEGRLTTDTVQAEVQVDVFARNDRKTDKASEINGKLLSLLHRQSLDVSGFNAGQAWCIERGRIMAEQDANRIMSRYRIWANE